MGRRLEAEDYEKHPANYITLVPYGRPGSSTTTKKWESMQWKRQTVFQHLKLIGLTLN